MSDFYSIVLHRLTNTCFSQELSSYTDQPDVIVHVALVKAKPGVFIDDINYILVICTPVTVLLIGLSVTDVPGPSNRTRKQIDLYDTGMSIACGVEMTDVIGMNDGRVFMVGSQDGHLYELHYQEKEGWFGKRVQLIDHSISGVKNLFPLFSTPSSEGSSSLDFFRCHHAWPSKNITIQIALYPCWPMHLGAYSTH